MVETKMDRDINTQLKHDESNIFSILVIKLSVVKFHFVSPQIEIKTIFRKIKTFINCNALWTALILLVFLSKCFSEIANESSVKRDLTEHILNLTKLHKEAMDDISGESIKSYLEYFSMTAHFGGSDECIKQGQEVETQFRGFGFDKVEMKKYNVLLSVPTIPGSVTINDQSGTEIFRTSTFEKVLEPSENNSAVTPPYSGFSPSGKVTGRLVYAYFGRERDYEKLAEQGINVTGKIVIVRYGNGGRGKKIDWAEYYGALGVIIYGDPKDFAVEGIDKVYPDYNWLPSTAVARGSVKRAKGGGDLLTPQFPAIDGIYRRSVASLYDFHLLPKIPVFPISYGDAQRLLSTLTGKLPRPYWKGDLPIDYGVQTDPSDTRTVTLEVNTQLIRRDIYNVIGYIRGHAEPDHIVVVGNHRDAWIYGGTDAASGTAVLMELARVFGDLVKKGWKPRRTIVFGSWDAEEVGVIGSTEWVEEHLEIIKARVIAYINVDQAIDGNYTFRARSFPILEQVVMEAAKRVNSPDGNETVLEEWIRKTPKRNDTSLPKILKLGMDSDYAPFYNLAGVPCLDVRYTYNHLFLGDRGNPLYHTLHDTFHLVAKLMDPTFKYHQATARVMGHVLFLLADSSIIPFNGSHYAYRIGQFRDSLVDLVGSHLIDNRISLDSLNVAIKKFAESAEAFQEVIKHTSPSDTQNILLINSRLIALEKAFLYNGDDPIIPEATARKHCLLSRTINGKSHYFPGITDAVRRARQGLGPWENVKKQISVVVYSLLSATKLLNLSPI